MCVCHTIAKYQAACHTPSSALQQSMLLCVLVVVPYYITYYDCSMCSHMEGRGTIHQVVHNMI